MNRRMSLGIGPEGVTVVSGGARVALAEVLLFAGLAMGCGGSSKGPLGPSTPRSACELNGWVQGDEKVDLLSGGMPPLGDATVTVLDGPNAGNSALSSPIGRFTIDVWKSGDALFEVRKDGYETITERKTIGCGLYGAWVFFTLGQPPHTLSGSVYVSGTHTDVEAATVEILDGANAGRSTQTFGNGVFVFYGLETSEPFSIRLSKIRFRTTVITAGGLKKNTVLDSFSLPPQ
jgi:hypothetical protein